MSKIKADVDGECMHCGDNQFYRVNSSENIVECASCRTPFHKSWL